MQDELKEKSNRNIPAEFVAKMLMEQGKSAYEIMNTLMDVGLDSASAREMVEELEERHVYAKFLRARRNMLIGAICCFFGCVIAAYNHATAASDKGFILAWGAIILGCLLFFKGQLAAVKNEGL
jgi:hypothetical protein